MPQPAPPWTATLLDDTTGRTVVVTLPLGSGPIAAQKGEAPKPSKDKKNKNTGKRATKASAASLEAANHADVAMPNGTKVSLRWTPEQIAGGMMNGPCPACGCEHLYFQRDFNRELGLSVVGVGALLGLVWSAWQGTIYPLFGCLVVSSLMDVVVHAIVKDVVVCYRCLTAYRGLKPGMKVLPYDQAVADGLAFSGQVNGSGFTWSQATPKGDKAA